MNFDRMISSNSEEFISIAEIQLPCIKDPDLQNIEPPCFIYENGTSSYNNIQQLALAVSCNQPVLLQGPVGAGKTCTVEYLAFITGHKQLNSNESANGFVKVQLGEQTDSRILLGGYQSTEIPGQFLWKPGVLTNAVVCGHWILLEDIDSTSSDVVTVINNLAKSQTLSVPGYGDNIVPHPSFRLFATQRTLGYDSNSAVKCEVLKHWFIIQLKPLGNLELAEIISKKYPPLSTVASKLVSILELDFPTQSSDRIPSARDLLKWCSRCAKYFEIGNFNVSLRVFQDALDIFCGYMDKGSRIMSEQIGFKLGIVKNKANFLNERYKPNIMISGQKFVAGRCSLDRRQYETVELNRSKNMIFSLNAPSCRLIEKIACCMENNEPVLLIGETGCGKTTVLQYMAQVLGRNLIVINMNQQSDTTDLIGGFKPVTFKWIMKPICDQFESLFRKLFDPVRNRDCLEKFLILYKKQNWNVLLKFIIYVQKRALHRINTKISKYPEGVNKEHLKCLKWKSLLKEWEDLGIMVQKFTKQCEVAEKSLVFSFIEGSLVKAVKQGDWVLLDEINLASSETLDCLNGLLEDSQGSLYLLEKGESTPIPRDSGFRLFAAMNPATDIGKKRLPFGLRNRFTEFYIEEPGDSLDLYPLVETYLSDLNLSPEKLKKIVNFYLKIKKNSNSSLLDGNGKRPHYSLRNLCRALLVASKNLCGNTSRSLYEGLHLSFLTQLDKTSYKFVYELVSRTVADSDIKAVLNQPIPKPLGKECVNIEGFWIAVGNLEPTIPDNYILTETVKRHLQDIIRIISLGSGIPVLLEGDTSVGKTSLINYLAKCTGNFCARVNNHEHTDIQEYIGTYIADSKGKLIFKEGILCEAMRKGYWLILDELNLAPSDVLEALNRVLDDNRELFVPETQTVIKAHEKFMLFATQNPPGLYGGRKELSRAFKNRFIELQFNQIPPNELVTILEKRCHMPLNYCRKMIAVMTDLQLCRRGSEIFIGKSGFITLRDLFRWGERYQKAVSKEKFYDWEQHLADEGYILLAGRVRLPEECKIIEEVIKKHFKRNTSPHNLFSLHENTSQVSRNILETVLAFSKSQTEFKHIVWTYSMRRLAVLVCKAIEFSEPVLLVGETGCGKTTIVQILALLQKRNLLSVNCHTHSESSDFLGGLRPVRQSRSEGKLFEWCDGPLVQAMKTGSFFLADEISLADDSVLERLNSLLEPERTILLTEKGGGLTENDSDEYVTIADKNFQFFGTMNPGGDFGKKELSPALRNRFTEIWVEVNDNKREDYQEIINFNLNKPSEPLKSKVSEIMVRFIEWFQNTEYGKKLVISIRDILTWIEFMNLSNLKWFQSCIHGSCLTFLDGLGCGRAFVGNIELANKLRKECIEFLTTEINKIASTEIRVSSTFLESGKFTITENAVGIEPFYIDRGNLESMAENFVFNSPTTSSNALRLLRGLQMKKAILLEGSPGVGKTSLVTSLAKASGHLLTRINLSDQTDISDLFGADLPEEGAAAGHFIWRDGPFLTALKEGHWILLDELNLALQSVLEGLNAVLDHRGSVYIPELNKTFYISKNTKLFACQNPLKEGGNRRGLPKSFLNRFTQVSVEPLTIMDYAEILQKTFPVLATLKIHEYFIIDKMIEFNHSLCEIIKIGKVGSGGGPWEFNLRDITRWAQGVTDDLNFKYPGNLQLLTEDENLSETDEVLKRILFKYANLLYFNRFRTKKDVDNVFHLFEEVFGYSYLLNTKPLIFMTKNNVIIGENVMTRNNSYFFGDLNEFEMFVNIDNRFNYEKNIEIRDIANVCGLYRGKRIFEDLRLLEKQYDVLSFLCQCIKMNWLTILVGDYSTGKTSSVRTIAALLGHKLRILPCNSAMDTTEILGGFEQMDYNRHLDDIVEAAKMVILTSAMRLLNEGRFDSTYHLVSKWLAFSKLPIVEVSSGANNAFNAFTKRLEFLIELLNSKHLGDEKDLKNLIEELCGKLLELKNLLSDEDCLTSGGKFEWVDSVLVKCLKDGSWLLMEDVNLCSNAVLDRLNCLLEPNGILTVGERGALPDGSLAIIKPHPDFRLFFTMNPRNGTISRAMRNRGVEIYLRSGNEDVDWPQQDKLALLCDKGIKDVAGQKVLMEFESHQGNANISNLIANGFWMAQYIKHGFDKPDAFRNSTQQVYKIESEEMRQLVAELSTKLNSHQLFSISYARPSLNNYLIDPNYAMLKQKFAFFVFVSEILKKYRIKAKVYRTDNYLISKEDLEYFFGSDIESLNLSASDGIKYSILYIYLTINVDSLKLSVDMFLNATKGLEILVNIQFNLLKLSKLLTKTISEVETKSSELPWDLRWYKELKALYSEKDEKNKTVLLVKYLFLLNMETKSGSKDLKKFLKTANGSVTVAQYSKAVQDYLLEDTLSENPVAAKFNIFLERFDELIIIFLKHPETNVDIDITNWFLTCMKWRFYLGQLGNEPLLSASRRTVFEDTLTQLKLHLCWFQKYLMEKIKEITLFSLPQMIYEKYVLLGEVLEQILKSETCTKLVKISNLFRHELGQPPPNKYLINEKYVSNCSMEISEFSSDMANFSGDAIIIRTVVNKFVHYFHALFIGRNLIDINFTHLLSIVDNIEILTPVKILINQCRESNERDIQKLSSEIMFHCLRVINTECAFYDDHDEKAYDAYSKQILLFHRPVWMCHIIHFLFGNPDKWSLGNYKISGKKLSAILATVLPQTSHATSLEMDPRENEWAKLSTELNRVRTCLKKSLGLDPNTENFRDSLNSKLKEAEHASEKVFYDKVLGTVEALSSLKLTVDSGYDIVGCFWILLGSLELFVLGGGKVDPIRKKLIKAKYLRNEIIEMEAEIQTFELNSKITGTCNDHVYMYNLRERLNKAKKDLAKYRNLEKIERNPEKFTKLCSEVDSFVETFDDIIRYCNNVVGEIFQEDCNTMLLGYFYRKAIYISNKTRHLISTLEKEFINCFGDLTYPLLAASAQIEHGLNLVMSELLRIPYPKNFGNFIKDLCVFPMPEQKESQHPFHLLTAVPWHPTAMKCLENDKLLLLFSSCLIKCNEWLIFKNKDKYNDLIAMFSKFVEHWKMEEEKKSKEEEEKESLYVKKEAKKCVTVSEEEELNEKQLKLFPTYEKDFEDTEVEQTDLVSVGHLTSEQLSQITVLHMKIVKEGAEFDWVPDEKTSRISLDFLNPLRMRYLLLSHLLPHISFLLEYNADEWLLPGLLPLIHAKEHDYLSHEAILFEGDHKIYDFYKDKNVSEVIKCLEILNGLKRKSIELLKQWPEHPALNKIILLIDRIMGFSIDSPVMKFLTGLEILLENCQHWESVAHSGVSIADYLVRIINLVIEWRKLELQGWKTCFQLAHSRIKAAASKQWFHFWCLVEEYLSDNDPNSTCLKHSLNELLELLCKFIETSPIGEFETRLNILLSFHYHIVRLNPSSKRDELAISCWNLYSFYHQYSNGVSKKLETLGAPIRKKLSDYVKIAKWNDVTYWSIKKSIEKSHRVLSKFVREYEGILKQQVQLNTIDINDEEKIMKKRHLYQNINKFLIPLNSSKETSELIKDSFLINNIGKKFEKLKKFCSDIILTAEYPNLILNMEHLSEQICENSEYFMNLDVDRTLSKEQQKSQAKSIVHQKRRALADLFKTLQRIGLSYRTGLHNTEFGILQLCQMPPMIISERKSGNKLCGESYYLKTMARKLVLENSLLAPSKEIGPQIIERLRGYTSHIIDLNKEQKLNFCRAQVALKNLRLYEATLSHLVKGECVIIPDQQKFSQHLCQFKNMINETFYIVLQFNLILKAWPSEGDNLKKMNFLGSRTPEILVSSNQEESYMFVQQKFQQICDKIENLKELCEKLNQDKAAFSVKFMDNSVGIDQSNLPLYNLHHIKQFNAYVEDFKNVIQNIEQIRLSFCSENNDNCLVNSLKTLEKYSSCGSLQITYVESDGNEIPFEIIEEKLRSCVENILLTIQKFVKKYKIINGTVLHNDCKVEDNEDEDRDGDADADADADADEESDVLQDNHLTVKLIQSLKSDLQDLNIERINADLLSVIKYLYTHSANKGLSILKERSLGILDDSLIFIKQFAILCSYFVEQQKICYRTSNKFSSIFTKIFIILAQKGFCIPPEYEEDGEGMGNQGSGAGGFGLGDGEGEKDVSDRIESEDQLEGAEPKEKEKTDDHDCKEEDKGIEMSEDFDGKAQDLDKKKDDDDGTSEEEEPDVKEMGETEEGAEKLEKELWSSDSEKEENEEEQSKKEEQGTGKGKQTTEDKYAGKEYEGEEQKENESSDKKEKEKEDINEINEQEDTGDQIDPYHGRHQPELEPEPFELPDNINLDEGEGDKAEEENENPFDIDAMKEVQPPNEIDEEKKSEEKEENMEQDIDSSDNEDGEEEKNREIEKQDELMDVDNDESEENMNESNIEKKESTQEPEGNEEEKNENEKSLEEFKPSDDTPTTQPAQPAPDSEKNELASKDQVVGTSKQPEFESEAQEVTEKPEKESKGTGQAEVENMNEGHEVGASNKEKVQPGQFSKEKTKKRKRKGPSKSDENRTLGDDDLTVQKKLKTLDELKDDKEDEHDEDEMSESDLYQHMKEKVEKAVQIIDAATKEQVENHPIPNKEEEKGEELDQEDEVTMNVDEDDLETEKVEEICSSKGQKMKESKKQSEKSDEGEPMDEEASSTLKIEGDKIETLTVERGPDTTYHTQLIPLSPDKVLPLHGEEVQALRLRIQEQLAAITQSDVLSSESIQAWQLLNSIVEGLSRDLTEQLRLILEPTKATRLKGDYRTGRRINMRRIISYIASEFRKDNIWLRRMKPWKRDHEIVLAIDDSSSMADNNSKELAFESLALVSRALGLLEAGELGVLSFGEKTKIVHRLGDPFTDETGARLLQEFTFSQNKTLISEMLDVSSLMMTSGRKKGEVSQLLMIISDGRGVFSEGLEKVNLAVRRATDQGIFLVFVIIDEPKSKDSIMDIRMPEFKDGKFLGIKSYLEQFPFPYYLILRDISALPRTLSDALRQWFQLITSSSTS